MELGSLSPVDIQLKHSDWIFAGSANIGWTKNEVMKRFAKKYCFSNFRDIGHMTNAFKMILDNINEKPKLNGSHSSLKLTNWDAAAK